MHGRLAPGGPALQTSRLDAAFIGSITLLVGALALCINRVHTGDLFLNLSTGRFISQHGLVAHDPFNTIAAGRPWLNGQWLAELAFYKVVGVVGLTGLTLIYALALGLPLSWLLWRCRAKGSLMLAAGAILYFPTILAIVHPRAAVFTLAGFSLLVVLLLRGWPSTLAIPVLFAVWANLHGGWVAGLVLLGLVGCGTLIDHAREARATAGDADHRWRHAARSLALLALATAGATFLTPLGPRIWEYIWSFRNPAISVATQEWGPAVNSPAVVLYVGVAAVFVAWLWAGLPRPRPLAPLILAAGFLGLTVYAQRNIVLLGPVMIYLIATCAPERPARRAWRAPVVAAAAATVGAAALWSFALGPARTAPYLKPHLVDMVLPHEPHDGRIASIAGVSSYLLWRSAGQSVVIDGRLEHYTPRELRGAYAVLRPHPAGLAFIRAWRIGGVITKSPWTVRWLTRHGFQIVASNSEGTYLSRAGT